MIPTPKQNDIPESPERMGPPVRGPEPLPLLFATLQDLEDLKKVVKTLDGKVKDLEGRMQAIEGRKE